MPVNASPTHMHIHTHTYTHMHTHTHVHTHMHARKQASGWSPSEMAVTRLTYVPESDRWRSGLPQCRRTDLYRERGTECLWERQERRPEGLVKSSRVRWVRRAVGNSSDDLADLL